MNSEEKMNWLALRASPLGRQRLFLTCRCFGIRAGVRIKHGVRKAQARSASVASGFRIEHSAVRTTSALPNPHSDLAPALRMPNSEFMSLLSVRPFQKRRLRVLIYEPGAGSRCVVGMTFERLRVHPGRGQRRLRRPRFNRARGAGRRVCLPRRPAAASPCEPPTPGTASLRATRCRVQGRMDGSFGPTDGSPPSPCAPITAAKKRVDESNTLRPDSTELNQYRAALWAPP